MWRLESEKEGDKNSAEYHVLPEEELVVGRKACDILIVNDASVSRKHATIGSSHPMCNVGNLKMKSVCLLKDCGSKYGTFVNGKQVGNQGVILKHNDLITFGQCGSNFRVTFKPIVVTTSCMEPTDKATLKDIIRKLGGHVIDEWNTECTHLAMSNIKVTVKTVCALASDKPIVDKGYFQMLLHCYNTKTVPDGPEKFLPKLDEVLLNQEAVNFSSNAARSRLFENKSFIFLTSHQYSKLRPPITLASGKVILKNRSRCEVTNELLLSSCVIQCPLEGGKSQSSHTSSQTCSAKEIEDIEKLLQSNKKRFIPESDVGLAMVHCSVEQYCNPDYEFELTQSSSVTDKSFKLQSQTLSQNVVYETLENTQPSFSSMRSSGMKTTEIPPTFRSSCMSTDKENEEELFPSNRKKRSASSESKERSTSKVLKTEGHTDSDHTLSNVGTSDLFGDTQPTTFINKASTSNKVTRSVLCASDVNTLPEKGQDIEKETVATRKIKVEAPSPPASQETLPKTIDFEPNTDAVTQPLLRNVLPETLENTEQTFSNSNSSRRRITEIPPTFTSSIMSTVPTKEIKKETSFMKTARENPETTMDCESNFDADTQPASQDLFNKDTQETLTVPAKRMRLDPEPKKEHKQASASTTTNKESRGAIKSDEHFASGHPGGIKARKVSDETVTSEKEDDVELPTNLLVVKLADLIVERRRQNIIRTESSSLKNFKKFKKTAHCGADSLPRIIGGNDLIVHTSKENHNDLNEILQHQETQHTQQSLACNTSFRAQFAKLARTAK